MRRGASGPGRRSGDRVVREEERAQHQCRGMGVGHLDTFHLPGYAVGPS